MGKSKTADMAQSTRLVILCKNIYTASLPRLFMPVSNICTKLVYPVSIFNGRRV